MTDMLQSSDSSENAKLKSAKILGEIPLGCRGSLVGLTGYEPGIC